MLWNTSKHLSSVGWNTSDDSIDGTMMGQNSHAPMDSQSLVRLDTFASSLSHMTNPPSSKTMNATRDGTMRPEKQNQRPRVMARR
jgi:hypothetical protein